MRTSNGAAPRRSSQPTRSPTCVSLPDRLASLFRGGGSCDWCPWPAALFYEEAIIAFKEFTQVILGRDDWRKNADAELLRSELFSIEQLKRHAATLATRQGADFRPGPDKLLARLADNEKVLLAAYDVVTGAVTKGQRIAPAESWFLGNFYLIEQQIILCFFFF